jgi:hypothetical protein
MRGRDSIVRIAAGYGLNGPGIETRWERHVQNGSGAHLASNTMGTGSYPGVKRPESSVNYPSPFSAEVKEMVELYSSFVPSWYVIG